MGRAARRLGIRLAGGDTTQFPLVSISLTVLGEIEKGHAIARRGARPGDLIYVSGRLGRAAARFRAHAPWPRPQGQNTAAPCCRPHLYPEVRLELGAWLARKRLASAMMDLSDGLSTDLHRLCGSSAVGARLIAQRIPAVQIPAIPRLARGNLDPLSMALHGGEDYELLFTVPANKNSALRRAPGSAELTEIGEITRGREVVLVSSEGRAASFETARLGSVQKGLAQPGCRQRWGSNGLERCCADHRTRAWAQISFAVPARLVLLRVRLSVLQRLCTGVPAASGVLVSVSPCSAASAGGAVSAVST